MNISSHFSAFLANLYKILLSFGLCHFKKVKNWFKISEKQTVLQNFEHHVELCSPYLVTITYYITFVRYKWTAAFNASSNPLALH